MSREAVMHKKEIVVRKEGSGWFVCRPKGTTDSSRPDDAHRSKEAALITAGTAIAVNGGGSVRLEDENGDVRQFDILPVPAD